MKTRTISAIFMLVVFVPILLLGDLYYPILFSILGIMALWEMMNLNENIPMYMKFISSFACLVLTLFDYQNANYFNIINFPLLAGMFLIYSFSIIINKNIKKYTYKDGMWLMFITLLIGFMFNTLIHVRVLGLYQVIYCFLITVITDTFALLGGMKFGKHKLAVNISPHKTIEGSIIGSFFGTLVASTFHYLVIGDTALWLVIAITFVLTIFGQIGDLFFSSIKRYYKVKDFSHLIPGHGGVLDRLDSIIFVSIGYLLYLLII